MSMLPDDKANVLQDFIDTHYVRDCERESIVDLMTDLLHLAQSQDIDPERLMAMVEIHFNSEIDEDSLA